MKAGSTMHDDVASRLAVFKQRYPENRRRLVDALYSAGKPLTVPEIVNELGDVPLSSVYRNLDQLAEAGVVQKVAGADDSGRYELAEELSGDHHHHLICSNCGTVYDISSSPRLEKALSDAANAASDELGFEVDDHRIELIGRCEDCR
jgi:Fur family ferric uptake transcriptional regulator